jgi:branched-chain amino acid aminotransferase
MVDFNGAMVQDQNNFLNHRNRGFRFGDSLFETVRAVNGKIFFWEDHYLRLMSSMRILRMDIPMSFTMEFLERSILNILEGNNLENTSAGLRITVFRDKGSEQTPENNNISYIIEAEPLADPFFFLQTEQYEIELFKDFYVNTDMLSTLETNNKMINVLGAIYAKENGYQDVLLLNHNKQVVASVNGNIFMRQGNTIKTPPLSDGCGNGVIRKKLMEIVRSLKELTLIEDSISPFDLQKADELFVANTWNGIRPITQYRKKSYDFEVSRKLLAVLNAKARLEQPGVD